MVPLCVEELISLLFEYIGKLMARVHLHGVIGESRPAPRLGTVLLNNVPRNMWIHTDVIKFPCDLWVVDNSAPLNARVGAKSLETPGMAGVGGNYIPRNVWVCTEIAKVPKNMRIGNNVFPCNTLIGAQQRIVPR